MNLSDLFRRYESGGNYYIGTGGTDLSNAPLGQYGFPQWGGNAGSHAAGFFQFEPGTWNPTAQRLGITDFSPASQNAVFQDIYGRRGLADWTCPGCNPGLTAEVARQGGAYNFTNDLQSGQNTNAFDTGGMTGGDMGGGSWFTPSQESQINNFGQNYDAGHAWNGGGINPPDPANQYYSGSGVTYPGNTDPYGYGVDAQGNPIGGANGQYSAGIGTGANGQYAFGGENFGSQVNPDTGFKMINPGDAGFNPEWNSGQGYPSGLVVDMGSSSGAAQYGGEAFSSAGGQGAGIAGVGQPVYDSALAQTVKQAGQSIAQAISGPLSKATTTEGQDIVKAGQTSAATSSGILAGAESWLGQAFVVAALFVIGVVFVGVGLTKFGGGKILVAHVKA